MTVEWRDIPGYESYYQVSSDGRVRGLDRIVPRIGGGSPACRRRGAEMKQRITSRGYFIVALTRNGACRRLGVNRLVAQAFLADSYFPGAMVLHGDGNPLNNAVYNLRWGTNSENQLDSVRHGTHKLAARTHCVRNHPLNEANTRFYVVKGRTRRSCRVCDRQKPRGPIPPRLETELAVPK